MSIGNRIKSFLEDLEDKRWIRKNIAAEYKQYKVNNRYSDIKDILTEEEKQQIDNFYMKHYGKKISYFFHNIYKSYSGKFSAEYLPECLYYPLIYHFNNLDPYRAVLSDKNFLPIIAKAAEVSMPKLVVYNILGTWYDKNHRRISQEKAYRIVEQSLQKLIIKPSIESAQGSGIQFLEEKKENVEKVLEQYKKDFVIQEVLEQHSSLACLHPESLNTMRIVSYRMDGEIHTMKNNILRMGIAKHRVDNASVGGFIVGVKEDGSLQNEAMKLYCEGEKVSFHPDTGIVFEGHHIENFHKVLEAAIRLHERIPYLGFVDWDFSIDQEGNPVLIEANVYEGGGMRMSQWANGEAAFGENTAKMLMWLQKVEKMSKQQRRKAGIHI